jgi:hypothetical protein
MTTILLDSIAGHITNAQKCNHLTYVDVKQEVLSAVYNCTVQEQTK